MGIKSILDRLFRRQEAPPPINHHGSPSETAFKNPVAIPVPEGMPPELLTRIPTRQPRDPSRKGKRRTPEEVKRDYEAWLEGTMHQNRVRFEFERDRAEAIGVTHYRWKSSGDSSVCKICRSRNGKRFPLRSGPKFKHPGFMMCVCDPDPDDDDDVEAHSEPCRCYYEMIIPD